jgi:3-dehydroquinate dehydratase type I
METTFPSRICVSVGESTAGRLLNTALREAERGESFFEFCLEFLHNPAEGPQVIRDFLSRRHEVFIIATCRRGEHNFSGSIEVQQRLLDACLKAGARGIDVEIETARHVQPWMNRIGEYCTRIVSWHDYRGCPFLEAVIQELETIPADIIKVAVKASGPETLYQLQQAAWQCRKPNLMLAMGQEGIPTRIMAPLVGQSFTYASPLGHNGTAAGQPDARFLREIYHLDQLELKDIFESSTFPSAIDD